MPTLYAVATPIGNLSDFSPRAIETLRSVALIAAEDTTHTIKLLNYFNIKTPMISYHKYNEAERSEFITQKMLSENIDIAIVTDAGTPCISDPGYDLINKARQLSIKVIGIPGPCAAVTALSISGFPVESFSFYGFLDRNRNEQIKQLIKIKECEINDIVLYESPFRIVETLKNIEEIIDCDVCVCNDITKLHEASIRGNITDIIAELEENSSTEKGEYVIILHKQNTPTENDVPVHDDISTEAKLTDIMVKNRCTLKDAVNLLHKSNTDISKKEIYAASLNLKNIFEQ